MKIHPRWGYRNQVPESRHERAALFHRQPERQAVGGTDPVRVFVQIKPRLDTNFITFVCKSHTQLPIHKFDLL